MRSDRLHKTSKQSGKCERAGQIYRLTKASVSTQHIEQLKKHAYQMFPDVNALKTAALKRILHEVTSIRRIEKQNSSINFMEMKAIGRQGCFSKIRN